MDNSQIMDERIMLFKNAVRHRKTFRVPHLSNVFSWKYYDAGLKLSEAIYDYDLIEKAVRNAFENYVFDAYGEIGDRNPLMVSRILGASEYLINDEKNAINVKDQCFMEFSEYPKLIENPVKFIWETILPRKCKALQDKHNSGIFKAFIGEYEKNKRKYAERVETGKKEYGLPELAGDSCPIGVFSSGYEMIFNFFRGIRGTSVDMRKDPVLFGDAVQALDEVFVLPALEAARKYEKKGTSPEHCFDTYVLMLGHTILSPKQFEKYYWPHLKRIAGFLEEYDKLAYFFIEGDSSRYYDFFNELPENRCALHVEQNDVFDMKKKVHAAIVGGMPVNLLADGTKEECVAYAKKLIDELACDGGYIFSENKMVSFANDNKRENFQAVCEFVNSYRRS